MKPFLTNNPSLTEVVVLASAAALFAVAASSHAAGHRHAGASFNVSATVVSSCAVAASSGRSAIAVDTEVQGTVQRTCATEGSKSSLKAAAGSLIGEDGAADGSARAVNDSGSRTGISGFAASRVGSAQGITSQSSERPSARSLSGSMTVRNLGATPMSVALTVEGILSSDDTSSPGGDVLASPAHFTLPAGGAQVIRVMARRVSDALRDHTFNVVLSDVSPQSADGIAVANTATRLLSVPLTLVPTALASR